MHTLLFYIFLALLFLYQGNTQNDGYTIELVHRYSPNSPFYNSSMTAEERVQRLVHHSASRYHRHTKSLVANYLDTNIIPGDGDYLIKIAIGSPPVDMYAIADTGSDLIWVQCESCDICYFQNAAMFDPQKSSSYKTLPCNSTICDNDPNMQCDDDTGTECEYFYTYGSGSTMSAGIMGTDLLTLDTSKTNCVFGCGIVQDGSFDRNAGGLVGLGGGPLSLISQLGPTIANKFSYCLTPITSNSTSTLRLGNNPAKTGSVVTPLVTQDNPTYYAINLKAISIGQDEVEINKDIVIDSGSTLTYLDKSDYSRLEALVMAAIPEEPIDNPPLGFKICFEKKKGVKISFKMDFKLNGGDVILVDSNFMIEFSKYVCLGIVPSEEEGDPMILGNIAQVNFEVEFDLKGKTVSFTPTICSQNHGAILA
ncbi:aspartic proteinase CDR1-like [Chenopodium quinoa]|nr:aspartic proteinase CDR1-like [Chenopodium quinoa]